MENGLTFKIINKKYIYVSFYADDGRLQMSTGFTLNEDGTTPGYVEGKKIDLKRLVEKYVHNRQGSDEPILQADIAKIIAQDLRIKREVKSDKIGDLFQKFIDLSKTGEILHKGKRYSTSTITIIDSAMIALKRAGLGDIQISKFGAKQVVAYKTFLLGEMKAQNTISAYVTWLLFFIKHGDRSGWFNNRVYEDKSLSVPSEEIDTHVYLSIEEIEKIRTFPISDTQVAKGRDFFVFGCYTGLRHSDLKNVSKGMVKNDMITISLKKGGNSIVIPMGSVVRELWEKYQGDLPVRSNAISFWEFIQKLGKRVGLDQPTIYTNTVGGKRTSETMPKYKLLGTHTMRRSFATNAFKAGVPTLSIMKITGHKSEKSFLRYIRISNEENAELMRDHAFFK